MTGGYIFIHAAPHALCPHIIWTLENLATGKLNPRWVDQPLKPGTSSATLEWQGKIGSAARFASALFQLEGIYFEITERATKTTNASRYMHTPSLGIFHAHTDIAGNFVVTEEQIKHAYEIAGANPQVLYEQFALALGQAWDSELEPLRPAATSAGLSPPIQARFV